MMNYYELLGVRPDAQFAEIRKAYRKLAMQYHPDRGGDPEKMRLLNEAYEVLSRKRAEYNAWLAKQEAEAAAKAQVEAEARARAEAEATAAAKAAEAQRRAEYAERIKYHVPLVLPPMWMEAIYYAWFLVPIIVAVAGGGVEALLLYLLTPMIRALYVTIVGLILGYDV